MDALAVIGTVAALGAVFVGGVQALIYNQQKKAQVQANKQALYDRRYQLYKSVYRVTALYILREGHWIEQGNMDALNDAVQEAEFIFPAPTVKQLCLIRDCIVRHQKVLPTPTKDSFGHPEVWDDSPETIKAMSQLKAVFAELPKHLEVMRLTK